MAQDSLAATVYVQQLRYLRCGAPLWQPEPPRDGEVAIGDVGYVNDGRFTRLFNAVHGTSTRPDRLPANFVRLEYDAAELEEANDEYMPPSFPQCSASMVRSRVEAGAGAHGVAASYGFKCEDHKGAIVVPGAHGALRLVRRNNIFFEYVRTHHRAWCALAQAIGLDIAPEELVLVSGWPQTTEWVVAAVLTEGRSHAFALSIDPGLSLVQASFDIERATNRSISTSQRSGPSKAAERRHNQCLFIRYYKAKYRFARLKWLGMKIVAAAEPQDLRRQNDSEGSAAVLVSTSGEALANKEGDSDLDDPLEHVLSYILTNDADADIAITCHEDVFHLFPDDWQEDFVTTLAETKPPTFVAAEGAGSIVYDALNLRSQPTVSARGRGKLPQAQSSINPSTSARWNPPLPNAQAAIDWSDVLECTQNLREVAETMNENREETAAIYKAILLVTETVKDGSRRDAAETRLLLRRVADITATIHQVTALMNTVRGSSLLRKSMNRRLIKSKLRKLRTSLQDVTTNMQISGHESHGDALNALAQLEVHAESILVAERRDDLAVQAEYNEMLHAEGPALMQNLGVADDQIMDAIVALSKYVERLPDGPEKSLCQKGLDAMRQAGGEPPIPIDHFAVSSFEVEIHREQKLGSGGYAVVYRGTYRGRSVAIKVFPKDIHWPALHQEVALWKQLSHPNILRFIGTNLIADPPFMISELKLHGHVHDYLRTRPFASRHKILFDASQGLVYLHERSVVHGDIKGTNILINDDGCACIADFGISNLEAESSSAGGQTSIQQGTARWMAPEQLNGYPASAKPDVYNFAMTIYEIFTGSPPLANIPDGELYAAVCERGERPKWGDVSADTRAMGLDIPMWDVSENC